MEEKHLLEITGISFEDWNLTPIKVRELVVQQNFRIEQLEQHLQQLKVESDHLQEKVNRNSDNSHSSPPSDLNQPETKNQKKKKRRKTKTPRKSKNGKTKRGEGQEKEEKQRKAEEEEKQTVSATRHRKAYIPSAHVSCLWL